MTAHRTLLELPRVRDSRVILLAGCTVLASDVYDEKGYICDYHRFQKRVG
jgi:hypothetical protein